MESEMDSAMCSPAVWLPALLLTPSLLTELNSVSSSLSLSDLSVYLPLLVVVIWCRRDRVCVCVSPPLLGVCVLSCWPGSSVFQRKTGLTDRAEDGRHEDR